MSRKLESQAINRSDSNYFCEVIHMELTLEQLKQSVPNCEHPERFLPHLNHYMINEGIITPPRKAHFLSQVAHESGDLNRLTENLNYSATALLNTFRKYFADRETAEKYARRPIDIANRVYANRMGNGPESSGDGWRYRGAGLIQLTGKNNHKAFADASGKPLAAIGDYLRSYEGAVHSAVWFWTQNGLNKLADQNDIMGITRRINGGYNGLQDRTDKFRRIIQILDK